MAGWLVNPFFNGGGGMPPSGGVIGSKAATTFTEYWNSTTYTYTSAFTPTTAGQVSYIYFDTNPANANPTIMTNARAGIWDASGNLVASSDACGPTNSGSVYRWALTTPFTLVAATTYKLGFHAGGDFDHRIYVVSTSGNLVRDETTHGASCVGPESTITDDATVDADNPMRIWASNEGDDW